MPPKDLHKVQKKISKKRGGRINALHEKSRDAKRLRRANAREDRLDKVATVTSRGRHGFLERVAFFQECLKEASEPLAISAADMGEFVRRHIDRSNSEIEELQQEQRKGRPPSKREEALLQRKETEEKEFKSGFWMPDLTQDGVRTQLAAWNGKWSSLSCMQFIRLSEGGDKHASTFPPQGLS